MTDDATPPPRPDAGVPDPPPAQKPAKTPAAITAAIIAALVVVLFAVIIIAAVTFLGRAATDQFSGVQFCVDNPNHPSCMAPTP